jgi:hypothetical protein
LLAGAGAAGRGRSSCPSALAAAGRSLPAPTASSSLAQRSARPSARRFATCNRGKAATPAAHDLQEAAAVLPRVPDPDLSSEVIDALVSLRVPPSPERPEAPPA